MSFEDQSNSTQQQSQEGNQSFLQVGDRTYSSADDVVKKIQHADQHISTIEQQNQSYLQQIEELQAKLAEASKVDQVLETLKNQGTTEPKSAEPTQPVNPTDLVDQVVQTLDQRSQAEKVKDNVKAAEAKMQEVYGDKWLEVAQQKAKELGMTMGQVDAMAGRSYKAWERLFVGDVASGSNNTSMTPDVNSAAARAAADANKPQRKSLLDTYRTKDRAAAVQERMKQYMSGELKLE